MLKIKDNVDLKELEKFGFEITKNNYEVMGEDCFEAIKKCGDSINEYDFIIHGRILSIYSEINKHQYKY